MRAEATATDRASVERYTFNEGGEANIIVDLGTALSNESGAMLRQVSATEVEGMRLWAPSATPTKPYFLYILWLVSHSLPPRCATGRDNPR